MKEDDIRYINLYFSCWGDKLLLLHYRLCHKLDFYSEFYCPQELTQQKTTQFMPSMYFVFQLYTLQSSLQKGYQRVIFLDQIQLKDWLKICTCNNNPVILIAKLTQIKKINHLFLSEPLWNHFATNSGKINLSNKPDVFR